MLIVAGALVLGASVGYIINNHNTREMERLLLEASIPMDREVKLVESEREFLEGMIPHHEEAVATAKEVLERSGSTEEVRQLATDIIAAQEKEIADMKQWYQDWYGEQYVSTGNYLPMMRDLGSLNGKVLDIVFMEDMIRHHRGAIIMAGSVQDHLKNIEINDLTIAIKRTQIEEIRLMEELLKDLR